MCKVTVNGTMILQQHYLYRGYLQIAALDLTRSNAPALWLLHWDPAQPIATRPLSLRKNGTWYTYGHDLTKNVTELYKADGTIATAYDYTPYGSVTASGIDQPIQWSSEHYDPELALVYYNYRHYNPADGRWINRDPIAEKGGRNLYGFINNNPIQFEDVQGKWPWSQNHSAISSPSSIPPEAIVTPGRINCIGHSSDIGLHLRPADGVSLKQLFESLDWKCTQMQKGKCKCDCKTEKAMVIFIYIRNPNHIFEIPPMSLDEVKEYMQYIKNQMIIQKIDAWNLPWNEVAARTMLNGTELIDVHGLKRNCYEQEGASQAWEYVPEQGDIGAPNVAIGYRKDPNYFHFSEQIVQSMCCKKKRM